MCCSRRLLSSSETAHVLSAVDNWMYQMMEKIEKDLEYPMTDSLRQRHQLSLTHTHTRQSVIGWEWTPSPLSSLFCTNQMEITAHTHSGLFSEEMTHNSIARASVWVCVFVCLHILTWLDSLCVCLHGLKEREHGEQAPLLSWCVIMIISSHRLSVPAY